ncbi:MAG TPA: isochorismatase family protein [Xanthobacteraceae bacterium]|nr:isochorismatase family protein [Xanthobacteraceae bacterium]
MKREKLLLAFAMAVTVGIGTSQLHAASIIDEWASVKAAPPPPVKEVTVDPKTTALVMADFVQPICSRYPRCMASLPVAKKVLDAARAAKVLVVYTSIPKVPISAVVADVAPNGDAPFVQSFTDKFLTTDLEKILKDHGITTLLMTGVSSNGAIIETSSEAALRGFNVDVVLDATSAATTYAEQFVAWQLVNGPVIASHITLTTSDKLKF